MSKELTPINQMSYYAANRAHLLATELALTAIGEEYRDVYENWCPHPDDHGISSMFFEAGQFDVNAGYDYDSNRTLEHVWDGTKWISFPPPDNIAKLLIDFQTLLKQTIGLDFCVEFFTDDDGSTWTCRVRDDNEEDDIRRLRMEVLSSELVAEAMNPNRFAYYTSCGSSSGEICDAFCV